MASLVKTASGSRPSGLPLRSPWSRAETPAGARFELVHDLLAAGAVEHALPTLAAAQTRARRVYEAAGRTDAADRLAASVYAADVLVELAAEGQLDAVDTEIAAAALADACGEPRAAASFDVFLRTTQHPSLLELPPVVATEIVLKLLLHLGVASETSVWCRSPAGSVDCLVVLGGHDHASRRVRAAAKAALRRTPSLAVLGRYTLRTAVVRRFGEPHAVIVARVRDAATAADAYLEETATALSAVIEREHLLDRSAAREHALSAAGEKRLMRLGFDLHDGPIQEVLVLADEVRRLRDQVYPFVLESHRELAHGRFDDVLARLGELDRQLRETAHSLESKSVVSRPLGEILHREVDTFAERSDIVARLEIRGDPDTLTAAQRITVFRAIQESLANVREHAGATEVEIRVRARRNSVEVRITDNGQGFEVGRALARAAQRGRLGLVGIGERVRMLGGTFAVDSAPGGPTTLSFTLPRWRGLGSETDPA